MTSVFIGHLLKSCWIAAFPHFWMLVNPLWRLDRYFKSNITSYLCRNKKFAHKTKDVFSGIFLRSDITGIIKQTICLKTCFNDYEYNPHFLKKTERKELTYLLSDSSQLISIKMRVKQRIVAGERRLGTEVLRITFQHEYISVTSTASQWKL